LLCDARLIVYKGIRLVICRGFRKYDGCDWPTTRGFELSNTGLGIDIIYSFVEYPTRMHSFFNSVTTLAESNCRIHLRGRCRFVDGRRTDSGKSRLGAVSRDPGRLEEEHRLFVQLSFTEPQSFLWWEIRGVNETKTFRA
jgi:hypothetical protein